MKVRLNIFEGPLDLLLYLIKKNHIDICDIPISEVVDQYLQFLDLMKLLDINIASEYLVMAATLINIKSKMLLAQDKQEEEEVEDPRNELVKKLLEYEKYKELAQHLREREKERLRYIPRNTTNQTVWDKEVYFEASIFDLISAFKNALREVPKDIFLQVIKDEFTVEEKIHDILHMVLKEERIYLDSLFSQAKSKLEIIVIFLAILELIKLGEIVAIQESLFAPIIIARGDSIYVSQ